MGKSFPKLTDIQSQPCEVKNITLRTRGEDRERTAQFQVVFDYSEQILAILAFPGQTLSLKGLWDEDQIPQPGIASVRFSREFEHYKVSIARNNAPVMGFISEKISGISLEPKKGEQFQVTMRCFGPCSDGDAESLHKLLKDPGITLSFEATANSSELFG